MSPTAPTDAVTAAAQRFAGKTGAPVAATAGAPTAAGAPTEAPTGAGRVAPTVGAPPAEAPRTTTLAGPATAGPGLTNVPGTTALTTPADSGPALAHGWLAEARRTVNPDGSVTTHLPSGGTATAFDRTTPQGVLAMNQARKESSRLQGIPFSPVTLAEAPKPAETPLVAGGGAFGGKGAGSAWEGPGLATGGGEFGGKGAGSAWEGPSSPGQLATGPKPTLGPTPSEPTLGPFSGSIGNITQGPLPKPAGTPAAVPTPIPQVQDEELKRRLAQQQREQ